MTQTINRRVVKPKKEDSTVFLNGKREVKGRLAGVALCLAFGRKWENFTLFVRFYVTCCSENALRGFSSWTSVIAIFVKMTVSVIAAGGITVAASGTLHEGFVKIVNSLFSLLCSHVRRCNAGPIHSR